MSIPRITKIEIQNFKSIGTQSVRLTPFTLLVGPNGSGKSNFLDAMNFVQVALSRSIEVAFSERGGIAAVRRKSRGHPYHIGIRLSMELEDQKFADYSFQIAAKPEESFYINKERCVVQDFMGEDVRYEVEEGSFKDKIPGIQAQIEPDRLALFAASATEEFRPVYDFLTSMRFYSIVPSTLRDLQNPEEGKFLNKDGSNAPAVLNRLQSEKNGRNYDRLCRVLSKVVNGLEKVEHSSVGQKETITFQQDVGDKHTWEFDAINMSDGTLRVLGLLLSIYQPGNPAVVGIEEPENTVHPAVTEVIMEILMDAANERQIVITTHSPNLLNHKDLNDDNLRIVTMKEGETFISDLSKKTREVISKDLYTPGELLSRDELKPDPSNMTDKGNQIELFGSTSQGNEEQ